MIAEAQHLDVVHLPQRHIDRQLVRECFLSRIWISIEGMHVANQALLFVRQVGNRGVGRKQARRSRIWISGVVGEQEISCQMQQAQVSPIAGVKFLTVQQEIVGGRCGVERGAEIGDIGNALFFIDDEILHDRQIFRRSLKNEMCGRIPVSASIVHVHMYVPADPMRCSAR